MSDAIRAWRSASGPLVVAHRGDLHEAPENTMAAFQAAAEAGAEVIELDVQLSADGIPVVIHDEYLDRTTSGHGPVRAHPWRELARLDAGSWFGQRYQGEHLPALLDVLDWASDAGKRLLVEPKTSPVFDTDTAAALARAIGRARDGVIVYGSDHTLIGELGARLPDIPLGLVINERTTLTTAMLDAVDATLLSQSTWCLVPATVEEAHAGGRLVIAEARYPADVPLLASWGVDLIVTARTSLVELIDALPPDGRPAPAAPGGR